MRPARVDGASSSRWRLLIVDDEVHIAAALADFFSSAGCTVECAADAATAIALLDRFSYCAVVTDLRLSADGKADGLEVVTHAKRCNPRSACIVLTAHVDAESLRRAEQRGADAILQKPAPLPELADRITRILERDLTRIRT